MGGRTDGRTDERVHTTESVALLCRRRRRAGRKCPINGAHVFVAAAVVMYGGGGGGPKYREGIQMSRQSLKQRLGPIGDNIPNCHRFRLEL